MGFSSIKIHEWRYIDNKYFFKLINDKYQKVLCKNFTLKYQINCILKKNLETSQLEITREENWRSWKYKISEWLIGKQKAHLS